MGRRTLATILVALATLLGSLPASVLSAAAQAGAIGLTLDCASNPERTTITNNTDRMLALGGLQLTTLYQPRPGVEPFTSLPGGDLPPGGAITYLTGDAAPAGTLTLTRQAIYSNDAPGEGARLTTPYGALEVLCSVRSGTLPVGGAPPAELTGAPRCFPGYTSRCTAGAFRARWELAGGLDINGYPLSEVVWEVLEDGKGYWVQYFERVRMEWHPAEPDPQYRVQLGQFGRRILKADLGREADPPAPALPGRAYDPVTQHNFDPRFLGYWLARGGLAQFGRPLTETLRQTLEDGREYEVQYFERARFEWHPEQVDPQYQVLLGQFGRRICGNRC